MNSRDMYNKIQSEYNVKIIQVKSTEELEDYITKNELDWAGFNDDNILIKLLGEKNDCVKAKEVIDALWMR